MYTQSYVSDHCATWPDLYTGLSINVNISMIYADNKNNYSEMKHVLRFVYIAKNVFYVLL